MKRIVIIGIVIFLGSAIPKAFAQQWSFYNQGNPQVEYVPQLRYNNGYWVRRQNNLPQYNNQPNYNTTNQNYNWSPVRSSNNSYAEYFSPIQYRNGFWVGNNYYQPGYYRQQYYRQNNGIQILGSLIRVVLNTQQYNQYYGY